MHESIAQEAPALDRLFGLDLLTGNPQPAHTTREKITDQHRARVIKRCNRTCHYCGESSTSFIDDPNGRPWHIDHIVAVSRGGTNNDANLTLACNRCNSSKNNKALGEWVPIPHTDRVFSGADQQALQALLDLKKNMPASITWTRLCELAQGLREHYGDASLRENATTMAPTPQQSIRDRILEIAAAYYAAHNAWPARRVVADRIGISYPVLRYHADVLIEQGRLRRCSDGSLEVLSGSTAVAPIRPFTIDAQIIDIIRKEQAAGAQSVTTRTLTSRIANVQRYTVSRRCRALIERGKLGYASTGAGYVLVIA